ncbi:hypothetical protein PMZ80_000834 [Knufia obscura]|uniref:Uncharacterized protein n=2 Tax=Knufia TaxID=430999 RepID=A0AAN8EG16_9EURO|nr:hypothetical protein PMZ80_000834 [Knufia obscura]KAK5949902.1 hypothetical protein OHC33_009087 [Knufia fluminis]
MHDCTTSAPTCALYEPVTFTAGPSTLHFDGTGHWEILGQFDCKISGGSDGDSGSPSTAACAMTIGDYPQSELEDLTKSWISTPAASSASLTATFTDGDVLATQAFTDVTITGSTTAAAATASATGEGSGSGAGRAAGLSGLVWPCIAAVAVGLPMVLL